MKKNTYLIKVSFYPFNEDDNSINLENSSYREAKVEFKTPIDYEKFDKEYIKALFFPLLYNIEKNLERKHCDYCDTRVSCKHDPFCGCQYLIENRFCEKCNQPTPFCKKCNKIVC